MDVYYFVVTRDEEGTQYYNLSTEPKEALQERCEKGTEEGHEITHLYTGEVAPDVCSILSQLTPDINGLKMTKEQIAILIVNAILDGRKMMYEQLVQNN
ncbi:hypothetical protein A2635_04600 [Candidatus Peribacteria bacterium RIFCSPHIGHO2_01_FULL_51_9]|nr:MAG: hypothetical protein A2635_04600 [Candidatus Peribacteria bacterium RIFCSPHIGHO2_01_FULL_51_9]